MPDYQKGKIYKILNTETDDVYIGSTIQPLSKRLNCHKHSITHARMKLYKLMCELGVNKFYIELVENCPCSSKEELHAREGHWIRACGTLNQCVAGRKKAQYRIDKAEQIKVNDKQYYESNLEIIRVKASKQIECVICGDSVRRDCMKRHLKSLKCLNYWKLNQSTEVHDDYNV